MARMVTYDALGGLRYIIDETHVGYLDGGDKRDVLRKKLESYMRDYLCVAPHDQKFNFPQTAQVLRRSAASSEHFSGHRAALAWDALSEYADNLVAQPWRKEFRQIKLYCGFYKHKIESSLVGAELMFEAMGYKHSGDCTLTLHGLLDPDNITSVSKDAILAMVECAIMQEIWVALSRHVSWSEVLDFRENHTGTAEHAIRALRYKVHERHFQESLCRRPRGNSYTNYYDNQSMQHGNHVCPVPRYAHIVSPQQIVPPPTIYQTPSPYAHPPVLKSHDFYPTRGYPMHYPTPIQNGYSHPHYPQTYHHPIVPTAQLIELESSPGHVPHIPMPPYPYNVPEPVRNAEFLSSKAKDDGAGSWESWDYVYRSLETRKDNAEKESPAAYGSGDVDDVHDRLRTLNLATPSKVRTSTQAKKGDTRIRTEGDGEARHRLARNSIDVEEVVQKHRLTKSSNDSNAELAKSKSSKQVDYDIPDMSNNRNNQSNQQQLPKNKTNRLSVSNETDVEQILPSPEKTRRTPDPPNVVTLDVSSNFYHESSPVVNLPPEEGTWECLSCTFANSPRSKACEICGKSRDRRKDIKPQPCGGKQCPSCTLVNKPNRNFCEACNATLKNSPTYI